MTLSWWFLQGVLWALAFLYFRSYIKRHTSPRNILGKYRDEVDQLVAEINAATDRDLTLIEDRINSLRRLLDDADKRINIQHAELEKRRAEEAAYAALGKRYVVKTGQPPPVPGGGPPAKAPDAAEEAGGAAVPDKTAPRPRFIRSTIQIEPKAPPFAEQVLELYRGGLSSEIIAGKLGSTIAEVDLVIALSEQRTRPHPEP